MWRAPASEFLVESRSASFFAGAPPQVTANVRGLQGTPLDSKGLFPFFLANWLKNGVQKPNRPTANPCIPVRFPGEASNSFLSEGGDVHSWGRIQWRRLRLKSQREQRLAMVNSQLRTGDVVDREVLAAFLETQRERFVAPDFAALAYLDREIPARGARTRRLLPPLTLARMLQAAAIKAGDRALDVGGGSGYSATLLDLMGAKVVALELDAGAAAAAREELAGRPNVEVVEGPLDAGASHLGPFDVIIVEGAFRICPKAVALAARQRGPSGRDRRQRRELPGRPVRKEGRGPEPPRAVRDDRRYAGRLPARRELHLLLTGNSFGDLARRDLTSSVSCLRRMAKNWPICVVSLRLW